ncbi:MAG TPA: DUF4389 domain-containing protein [Acidimicrobiales bacterium]|nr:DUF4389 domain-containing protein [Acidimicrobiales bacterium]
MAVHLEVEGPQPQRRLTVAFRLVLVFPHLLFGTAVLGTIALFAMMLAWFSALLTARVPHGVADLLARILQYQARMYGYGQHLLTDRYPPFTIGPAEHPIELSFDEVGRFNRLAVLFRFVLMLPALVVTQIALGGTIIVLLVLWVIVLVTGRMPDAPHAALTAVLRYHMRTYAYVGLVTTTYPRGLFGEGDDDDPLVLSRASKNLILLFLVLGTVAQAFNVSRTADDYARAASVAAEIDEAHDELEAAGGAWLSRVEDCTSAECVRSANTTFGIAVDTFQQELWATDVPLIAEDEVDVVRDDLDELRALLNDTSDVERLRLAVDDALFVLREDVDDLYAEVLAG